MPTASEEAFESTVGLADSMLSAADDIQEIRSATQRNDQVGTYLNIINTTVGASQAVLDLATKMGDAIKSGLTSAGFKSGLEALGRGAFALAFGTDAYNLGVKYNAVMDANQWMDPNSSL
jgi:hypothetical protein